MTKEQEETINRLEKLINIRKNKAGQIKYDNCICSTTDIETILNMLKEKDAEIEKLKKENEHWKNGFERELEDNRENTCELLKQDLIIRKKDRQIDLMAEELKKHIFVLYDGDTITSKKGIIEHYERKATNDG